MERFRTYVVLYCLSKFNGERSVNGIYHLLQGKKSSQTIQDAKLFKLEVFFQAMPDITKKDIDDIVFELETSDCILMTNKDTYILTKKGYFYLKEASKIYPIPDYVNGWRYHKQAIVFWQRFTLSVQALSFLIHEPSSFLPVINDEETQLWVKRYLKTIRNRFANSKLLYSEYLDLLKQIPELHAEIFVLHLSGFHRIGYTFEQISHLLQVDKDYIFILFQSVLHFMIEKIENNPDRYHQLSQFLEESQTSVTLTQSAQKTYQLLNQRKSITEIALIRNLKESTIEDHIVEIASEIKELDIQPYIEPEWQEKILQTIYALQTRRLKPIRSALSDQVSYFQIRLMLGRMEK